MRDHIKKIVNGLDQPSVDGVNSYFVSSAARETVTVAISGTGGDEVFAGYPWFGQMVQYNLQAGKGRLRGADDSVLRKMAHYPFLSRLFGAQAEVSHDGKELDGFLRRYGSIYQIFGAEGSVEILSPNLKALPLSIRAPSAGR